MGSKGFIALFLLLIYIQPAESIRELFKLPLLLEHYYDHRTENGDPGLVGFLVDHYCTEDGTDQDADEDSKLPFKSTEQLTNPGTIALLFPVSAEMLVRPALLPVTKYLILDDANIPSGFLDSIWQPPRNC
jgi:hypothetical protein